MKKEQKIKLPNEQEVEVTKITRYDTGELKTIKLLKPTLIKTSIGEFKFKDTLFFKKNGIIFLGYFSEPQSVQTTIGEFNIDKGEVAFNDKGEFERGLIYKTQIINILNGGKLKLVGIVSLTDKTLEILDVKGAEFFSSAAMI